MRELDQISPSRSRRGKAGLAQRYCGAKFDTMVFLLVAYSKGRMRGEYTSCHEARREMQRSKNFVRSRAASLAFAS
jgi:hypothetical protein